MKLTTRVAALGAAATVAGALVAGASSSQALTGEDVTLHISINSDYSATAYVSSADMPDEKFQVLLARVGTSPAYKVSRNANGAWIGAKGAKPASAQKFIVIAQGGGPVLDTFYIAVTCSNSHSCTETTRDTTSHS